MSGMDCGLSRFGDARLEKGGRICMRPWLRGRARASADWHKIAARARYSSRAFFAMMQ